MEKKNGFQLLRALACVSILICHTVFLLEVNYGLVVKESLNFFGRYELLRFTSLFMALSGFISTQKVTSSQLEFNPVKYLAKRYVRLMPAYLLAIAITCILRLCVFGTVSTDSNFGLALLLMPGGSYILNVEWSLVYDIMFYIFCSIFVNKYLKKLFPFFIVAWAVVLIIKQLYAPQVWAAVLSFPDIIFSILFFNYVSGCAAYYIYNKFLAKKLNNLSKRVNIIFIFLLLFLIALLILFGEFTGIETTAQRLVYFVIVFFIIIIAACVKISNDNPIVKIGDKSYGIYLLHFNVANVCVYKFAYWNILLPFAGVLSVLITLITSYGFSSWCIKIDSFIKEQISKIPKKTSKKKIITAIAPALFVVACFAVTYGIYKIPELIVSKFEELQVVNIEESTAGFVEKFEIDGNDKLLFTGWAFDPADD